MTQFLQSEMVALTITNDDSESDTSTSEFIASSKQITKLNNEQSMCLIAGYCKPFFPSINGSDIFEITKKYYTNCDEIRKGMFVSFKLFSSCIQIDPLLISSSLDTFWPKQFIETDLTKITNFLEYIMWSLFIIFAAELPCLITLIILITLNNTWWIFVAIITGIWMCSLLKAKCIKIEKNQRRHYVIYFNKCNNMIQKLEFSGNKINFNEFGKINLIKNNIQQYVCQVTDIINICNFDELIKVCWMMPFTIQSSTSQGTKFNEHNGYIAFKLNDNKIIYIELIYGPSYRIATKLEEIMNLISPNWFEEMINQNNTAP